MSMGGLFMAGVLPGVAIGIMLMAVAYVISVKRNYPRYEEPFRWTVLASAFVGALPPLLIPLVIVLGIVFGVFTPTEAGAMRCWWRPRSESFSTFGSAGTRRATCRACSWSWAA